MNVLLDHIDFMPLIYGVLMFIGIAVMWRRLISGHRLHSIAKIGVFARVFRLHGRTMIGGFVAMIAAILAGLFLPAMMKK